MFGGEKVKQTSGGEVSVKRLDCVLFFVFLHCTGRMKKMKRRNEMSSDEKQCSGSHMLTFGVCAARQKETED